MNAFDRYVINDCRIPALLDRPECRNGLGLLCRSWADAL
jgi:hypothetical protein